MVPANFYPDSSQYSIMNMNLKNQKKNICFVLITALRHYGYGYAITATATSSIQILIDLDPGLDLHHGFPTFILPQVYPVHEDDCGDAQAVRGGLRLVARGDRGQVPAVTGQTSYMRICVLMKKAWRNLST